MVLSKEQSNIIYNIKAFCILSVVCAHTSANIAGGWVASRLSCFLSGIGSVGVPIFFLLSGMLFANKEQSLDVFLKKKVWSLLLPWFLTGTIVWLYVVLRKGGISFVAWINYVLGNGSYLYYMSMLLICYLVFWGKRFRWIRVIVLGGLSAIWLVLEFFDVVHTANPYINPLNWIAYFVLGILITQYDLLEKVLESARQFKYIIIIAWFGFIGVVVALNVTVGYWHHSYPLFELASFGLVLYLAMLTKKICWITEIGKQSFAIYLIHMPFANVVNALFAQLGIEMLLVFKPIIVIGTVMFCIIVIKYIEDKVKLGGKVVRYIGIR